MKDSQMTYNGGLTAEQFLFYEIRIVSKFYLTGVSIESAIENVKADNLFQYPTERLINRLARACYRRLDALNNENLVVQIANGPLDVAKQVNLYAIMRYNRLMRDFMINIIGEKFRQQDYPFSRKDLNIFFSRLQEQDDHVASWSDRTISKLKQVLTKCLVETNILDSNKDRTLNPILISEELESGIRANKDLTALAAFNCFRQE